MKQQLDYHSFIWFFETYKKQGFKKIDKQEPQLANFEQKLKANGQFFYIADLIKLKVLYASKGHYDFFGQIPAKSYPSVVFEASHPDEKERHSLTRSKLIKLGHDLLIHPNEYHYLNSNFRIKNVQGNYIQLMFQACLIRSKTPLPSVYAIMVHTDISNIYKINQSFHFYVGTDVSFFTFPDEALFKKGNLFTKREYEIISCLAKGMDNEQIASKLFLSAHTVYTHRRNLLTKTGKRNTLELVIELKEKGLI
jgi:DNA-binding CsgD family transcriptional regulator